MNVKEVMTRQMITDRFLALLEKAASLSLTDEVAATPKPGLVDRKDSGAHSDMDYLTFEDSIRAILPFIKEMAGIGASWGDKMSEDSPDKAAGCLFKAIRPSGVKAEKAMFAADIYSAKDEPNTWGSPWPPYSTGNESVPQPASRYCWNASL